MHHFRHQGVKRGIALLILLALLAVFPLSSSLISAQDRGAEADALAGPAQTADVTVTDSLGNANPAGDVGDVIVVDWTVANILATPDGLGGYDIRMEYDTSVVNVTAVVNGDAPFGAPLASNINNALATGFVTASGVQTTAPPGPTTDHVVLRVELTIVGFGNSALDLVLGGSAVVDTNGVDVVTTDIDGILAVNSPDIAVDPIVDQVGEIGDPVITQNLSINNIGLFDLDLTDITVIPAAPWLSLSATAGTIAPAGSLVVVISYDPNDPSVAGEGAFATTLGVTSNDPDSPLVNVVANFTVTQPPVIALLPTEGLVTTVTGIAFTPDTAITVDFLDALGNVLFADIPYVGDAVTDGAGALTLIVAVPAEDAGAYQVLVTAGPNDEADFTVPDLQGIDGVAGADGAKGKEGDEGDEGDPGPAGKDGIIGVDGSPGPPGPPGIAGPSGSAGANGSAGKDGIIGVDGATGPAGARGSTGSGGADGVIGGDGADGATGAAGPAGRTGAKGDDGGGALGVIGLVLGVVGTVGAALALSYTFGMLRRPGA